MWVITRDVRNEHHQEIEHHRLAMEINVGPERGGDKDRVNNGRGEYRRR